MLDHDRPLEDGADPDRFSVDDRVEPAADLVVEGGTIVARGISSVVLLM